MANTLLTIDQITNEALRLAHEKSSFLGTINRQFDEEFGRKGGKAGDTLRIRIPSQYVRRTGSRVMEVQDSEQVKTTLTVATQDGVDMRFNSREMSLDLDNFSKLHLEPAMAALISGVESDVLQGVTKLVYNQTGTWGTPPTDLTHFGTARAYMNQDLAPKDGNRFLQYDSINMGTIVKGLAGLFQDSTQIKEQYREGMMGRTSGFDWYENERVYPHVSGADQSGTVNDASIAEGLSTITTSSVTFAVGDVFTIANVNKVHPETKATYGRSQQFVVISVDGANDYTFSPAIYASGAKKNVDALPVTGAAVTGFQTASQTKTQALAYHKDAFTFATAALPLMSSAEKCVNREHDGISLRVWQDGDIRNDELLTRIDILYGYSAIRPQWASRISM